MVDVLKILQVAKLFVVMELEKYFFTFRWKMRAKNSQLSKHLHDIIIYDEA